MSYSLSEYAEMHYYYGVASERVYSLLDCIRSDCSVEKNSGRIAAPTTGFLSTPITPQWRGAFRIVIKVMRACREIRKCR
ncbi:hypothetical protein EVAR_90614_1 [Eumeta japonica]|uniref:Uncharacterized protein n=1 Tax=Eumeta variegata TaxID=151549 RepID=A0A4C1YLT5_EUMVA|nr:hypothetical protein EVAR_90614_1 [Eumeta japonica]